MTISLHPQGFTDTPTELKKEKFYQAVTISSGFGAIQKF